MKKSTLSTLFVLVLSIVMLAAFSGIAAAEETLSVYAWDANFNIPALKAAEAAFQKVHPDFKNDC